VQIESSADQGTKVLLLLPRSIESPSATPGRMEYGDEVSARAPGMCRVLLVEDDVQVASLTSAMLTELGYEVIPVTTGQAALNELAATPGIGLVLSDVMMPGGMDGMGLVREMRQRRISLPIVLVSGFSAAAKLDAEDEGIPLLPKPYTLRDLAAQLTSALSTPRARLQSPLS
jgi:CheY-like chemotaxis protein